jgi:hypothetical protein
MLWRRGLVATSPPATEEIGDVGREIESRQGTGYQLQKYALALWALQAKSVELDCG